MDANTQMSRPKALNEPFSLQIFMADYTLYLRTIKDALLCLRVHKIH